MTLVLLFVSTVVIMTFQYHGILNDVGDVCFVFQYCHLTCELLSPERVLCPSLKESTVIKLDVLIVSPQSWKIQSLVLNFLLKEKIKP